MKKNITLCLFSDSSNSGGENMYTMMKSVPGGSMPGVRTIYISYCHNYNKALVVIGVVCLSIKFFIRI